MEFLLFSYKRKCLCTVLFGDMVDSKSSSVVDLYINFKKISFVYYVVETDFKPIT